jgi:hypothetical protein
MTARALLPVALSLGGIAAAAFSVRCANDPPTRCGMASGVGIARYDLQSGPKDVTPGSGACAALLANGSSLPATNTPLPVTGEAIGTEEYLPDQSNAARTDSVHRSMAIEPLWIINRIQDAELNQGGDGGLPADAGFSSYPYSQSHPDPQPPPDDPTSVDRPYAWGFFDALYPNSSGICTATLSASEMDYPLIPAHMSTVYSPPSTNPTVNFDPTVDQPATHVRYEWRNVQVVLSGASVGQQLFADLTITRDGCTADYRVALLSPETPCAIFDDAGNTVGGDKGQCTPTAVPNVPNPTVAQLYGTGLPVGVPVACVDLNVLPVAFDGGEEAGSGSSAPAPDFECVPTRSAP